MTNAKEGTPKTEKKRMQTINRAIVLGNLGADPEIFTTKDEGESKIARFSVATADDWKGKDGMWKARTEWHQVVVYSDPLARLAETALKKGSRVYIEGQMSTSKWTDANGVERQKTNVVVSKKEGKMILFDRKENETVYDVAGNDQFANPDE